MSRTVSFRCSEGLDEFLEQEAERRMTTKSAVAQMIVAEYAQEQRDSQPGSEEVEEELEEESETEESELGRSTETGESESRDEPEQTEAERVMEKYSDFWYKPDGKREYAVDHPDPELTYKRRKYYRTKEGVADRLLEWYGDE